MGFQLQISKDRLDKMLGILKHALEKRATLPILQYILLETDLDKITFKATDMELAFEASLPIDYHQNNCPNKVLAVSGKKFVETIKAYPEGLITLELSENNNRLWLRNNGFNSEHNIQPGECFPELPKPDLGSPSVVINTNTFRKAIFLGSISVSKDSTKPALSGILLHFSKNFIRVVSTDGFRLAVVEIPCETGLKVDARLVVPKKALDLIPVATNNDDQITITWDDRNLFFDQYNMKFSTRRINGNYPAYEKVLPDELPKRVIIDREGFLKTLRVVGLKKDDYNKNVRLFFEFPNLRVFFQHPDEGVNQGVICFSGEEQPLELAFNIDYLTELLERLPGDEVIYQFKDDVSQGVFISPSIENIMFRYILMPVKFANPK